jgi:tetratricopeptide (TPR) repeat protein
VSTSQSRPSLQQILRLAARYHQAGDLANAAGVYKEALKASPDHPEILAALAEAESGMSQFASARANLRKAVRIRPARAELRARLAQAELSAGDADAALREADEAIRTDPALPLAAQTKAQILRVMGRRQDAYDLLKPLVDAGEPDAGVRIAFADAAASVEGDARAVEILEPLADDESQPPQVRIAALYRLAAALDRAGEYDRAFACAQRANEAQPSHWQAEPISRQFTEMIDATPESAIADFRRAKADTTTPVFILGMPRSGTSLVEQILASHPQVFAAGERREISLVAQRLLSRGSPHDSIARRLANLRQGDVDKEARNYIRAMKGLVPAERDRVTRITDKMPHNFLHLAVIDAVFPQAHVIHCVRDPRDTCLSCYMLEFHGMMHAYTRDLVALGRFYNDYARLMAHWKRVLRVPIMEVRYEDLVAQPERIVPEIVDFVGLPWDDACLRHHETDRAVVTLSAEQARKPIYDSSVARWKHYERHLQPLIDTLTEGGVLEQAETPGAEPSGADPS